MRTHLCILSLREKLDDGTIEVRFIDLESNLRLTLKLSKDSQVLSQTDDKGLVLLEFHIKGGRVIYPALPEVSMAIRKNERFIIAADIFLCLPLLLVLLILLFIFVGAS